MSYESDMLRAGEPDDDADDTYSGYCRHGVGFDEDCADCDAEAMQEQRLAEMWHAQNMDEAVSDTPTRTQE